jgi:SnoaL-like domain
MSQDITSGINAIGFYDDDLVRTDEGWRIARRTFTQVGWSVSGGQ